MFPTRSSVLRTIFYAIVLVLALAVMGSYAEGCSLVGFEDILSSCPSRFSAVIALSVITAICMLALIALSAFDIGPKVGEMGLTFLAFAANTAVVAITTSPRTIKRFTDPLDSGVRLEQYVPLQTHFILPWFAEFLLIAALVLSLDNEDHVGGKHSSLPSGAGSNPATHPGSKAGVPAV